MRGRRGWGAGRGGRGAGGREGGGGRSLPHAAVAFHPHHPTPTRTRTLPAPRSKLVDAAYRRTKELLQKHSEALRGVAELLLERETINQNDLVTVAGPRPWGINAQLKPYVDMMYEEDSKAKAGAGGEAGAPAAAGAASGEGVAPTSGATPGTDAAGSDAAAAQAPAPGGAAGEKKE